MPSKLSVRILWYQGVLISCKEGEAGKTNKLCYQAAKACGDAEGEIKEILIRDNVHNGPTTAVLKGPRVTLCYKDERQMLEGEEHRQCHGLVDNVDGGDWFLINKEPFGVKDDDTPRQKKTREGKKVRKEWVPVWPPEGDENITVYGYCSIEELEG